MTPWARLTAAASIACLAACDAPSPAADASADIAADGRADAVVDDAPAPLADVGPITSVLRRVWSAATCVAPNEAPLRDGSGPAGVRCVRVGADPTAAPDGWPEAPADATATRYVDAAATAGDGSRAHPFGTLSDALISLPSSGGVLIARGSFTLAASLRARGAVRLLGGGSNGGVTITIARSVGAFSASGAGSSWSVQGVSLRYAAGTATADDVAFDARDGATLTLRDVAIEDAGHGVRADGASVEADSVSVLRASQIGVLLTGRGVGRFRRLLVRDGALQGLRADGAHLDLRESMVAHQGRQGIQLFGAADATGGVSDCAASGGSGPRDCLERVASVGNTSVALYVENARVVGGRLLSLSSTRLGPLGDGDGLAVLNGATVELDAQLEDSPDNQGRGSALVANARTGLVVQGEGASLTMHGALVASNVGPGAFFADRATGREVFANAFVGNGALGVGATPNTTLASVQCNGIFDTRMGPILTDHGVLMVGDGLSVSGAATPFTVARNEITGNARFALVSSESAGLVSGNHGEGNGYRGVAVYGARLPDDDGTNRIGGAADPPATAPPLATGM